MLAFDWWWAMLLLPLPLLARRLLAANRQSGAAIQVPLLNRYWKSRASSRKMSVRLTGFGVWMFWVALLVAASRPFWLDDAVSRNLSGRDLMLAVDISGSMSETDVNGQN